MGGGNLMRSNFDHSEDCYLVGDGGRGGVEGGGVEDEPLVGEGERQNLVGVKSTGGDFSWWGGDEQSFS